MNCCYPFEKTDPDYAEPLYVKGGNYNELRQCYILILTCATVRAVHLEITRDFSSKSLVSAIRHFIARRGKPALFVSDNFKSIKSVDVKEFTLKNQIK